ncbi:hypothetical protein RRG08_065917 [Elysia crispata]|uniref:Uncharacterized protein n=1 Tax=Elysia crispata TaxID=231223 RepID=A0AAE1CJD2_9GAST|nr:hypothetical protein RRG08_065917 [Elysia crispata]
MRYSEHENLSEEARFFILRPGIQTCDSQNTRIYRRRHGFSSSGQEHKHATVRTRESIGGGTVFHLKARTTNMRQLEHENLSEEARFFILRPGTQTCDS